MATKSTQSRKLTPKDSTTKAVDEAVLDESAEVVQEDVSVVESTDPKVLDMGDTVTFDGKNDDDVKPAEVKKVKIMVNRVHTCTIGGERYHFEPNKQYTVPKSVKSILQSAGLLKAI